MLINKLDCKENIASLIFSREEIHILRKALAEYKDKVSSEDNEWLHLQLVGVDDILKDGNFARFLGYHMRTIELKEETNAENKTN
jgi:hypothetical protein